MHLNISSVKRQPFLPEEDELKTNTEYPIIGVLVLGLFGKQ